MSEVIKGRQTATVDEDVVVFLIGMRFNRILRPWTWLPAFTAMPRMLRELAAHPELGLLGYRTYWSGRVILAVQYWRSFEHLTAYARAADHEHLPAWREFNRTVRGSGDVGIFHETYRVGPGTAESLYANLPPFGMGLAVGQVAVASRGQTADRRMGTSQADEPAVAPY
jgi:Domain of unknown function (DUF4188)